MSEEVDYRNTYGIEKKSRRGWKIFGIIFVILVVLLIIAIIGWKIYLNGFYNKVYQGSIREIPQNALNQLNNKNLTYKSLNEMRIKMDASKNKISNNFVLVENTGKVKIIDKEGTQLCDDGSQIRYFSKYGSNEKLSCAGSISILPLSELKEYEVNGTVAVMSLAVDSLLIFVSEPVLDELIKNEGEKFSTEEVKGNLAHSTLNILRVIIEWGQISSDFRNNDINWNENTQLKVRKIREYSQIMQVATDSEIQNAKIYDYCMNIDENANSPLSIEGGSLLSPETDLSITGNALFDIEPNLKPTKKFCTQYEKAEKEAGISMLNSLSTESNPFLVIYKKAYINLLTRCYVYPKTSDCNSYMDTFNTEFVNYVNVTK